MAAKKDETRIEEGMARVAKANQTLKERAEQAAKEYSTPLVCNPRGPMPLAKKMADKFPTLTISLQFSDRGNRVSLVASPNFVPFELDPKTHSSYIENAIRQAEDAAAKAESYFPAFQVASIYAQGLDDASGAERELDDLRKKYNDLKDRFDSARYPMMMMHPFFR